MAQNGKVLCIVEFIKLPYSSPNKSWNLTSAIWIVVYNTFICLLHIYRQVGFVMLDT